MTRGEAIVGTMLVLCALASLGFMAVFIAGAQTQLAAMCAFVAFGALAAAFVVWEDALMPHPDAVEERESLPSDPAVRAAAVEAFDSGGERGRPAFLAPLAFGRHARGARDRGPLSARLADAADR